MLSPMQILDTPVVPVARIHLAIPREQIRHVMGPGLQELYGTLRAQGIAPAGPWLSHHLRMDDAVFDFEICVPVASPVAPTGRVQPGELAPRRVARAVYTGPYEGLGDAWGQHRAGIAAQGLNLAPDLWEVYLAGPEVGQDPAQWHTELNQPLLP